MNLGGIGKTMLLCRTERQRYMNDPFHNVSKSSNVLISVCIATGC